MRPAQLLSLALLLFSAAPVGAELLRFELNARGSSFPQTFADCEQRLRSNSQVQVQWTDQPWYDPQYSAAGGATVGNMSFTRSVGGYTDTLTWIQFDSPGAAQQYEIDAASWSSQWYQTRCEGAVCLQVYSSTGNQADMDAVFEMVTLRR